MAAQYDPLSHPRRAQIDKLRELVEGTRYVLKIDDGSEYDSAFHMFIWDGDEEIVHIVSQNPDFNTQANFPFRIRSIDYAQVRNINGYFN